MAWKKSPRKTRHKHSPVGKRRQNDVNAELAQRIRSSYPDSEVKIIPPLDGVKMSEVLGQFVEPYKEYAETKDAFYNLLAMAMVAWNMALFSEEERVKQMKKTMAALPRADRKDAEPILRDFIARKDRYFSQYRRMLLDFQVVESGSKWHISVVSSPEQDTIYPQQKRFRSLGGILKRIAKLFGIG
jgi:hypothetical protein